MKSTLFFAVILLMVGYNQAISQMSIGVKVGANFADTRVNGSIGNYLPDQNVLPGLSAGIIAEIPMNESFSFRPELNYIQKGFSIKESFNTDIIGINMEVGAKARTRINYIEMPLLLKYSYGNDKAKVYAIAGPNISYANNAYLRPVATFIIDFNLPKINIDLSNAIYNRWELSATAGVGGEVNAGDGKIFADVRYNLGLTNLLNNPIVDFRMKNQSFNISAGYAYSF